MRTRALHFCRKWVTKLAKASGSRVSFLLLPLIVFSTIIVIMDEYSIISVTSTGAGRVDPIPLNIKTGKEYNLKINVYLEKICPIQLIASFFFLQ